LLSNPLRDRFGIPMKLEFYTEDELKIVIERAANLLGINFDGEASRELAKSSRGTPRIALRLVKRIRDFANYSNTLQISLTLVQNSLAALGVDSLGLDAFDYKYLRYINDNYAGGPVGIETIAAGLSEDKDTIEDTIEPYLMQIGFISRTPRGRTLTMNAVNHLIK
jgi:Holliday junction DNA helicase RuvB